MPTRRALYAALAFTCLAATVEAADIGGAIIAAPGANSVAGTRVELCPLSSPDQADCAALAPIYVQSRGAFGYFKFRNVAPGTYRLVAYRDLNQTGDMDAGDEAAVYSRYPMQDPSDVEPGRLDVAIRLIPYNGDVNELFEARRSDRATFTGTIPVAPALLVRRWGGTGPIADVYNSGTGAFVGTTWSANGIEFRANGTYESADLYQQTSRCMVFIDKGRYTITGDRLRLTPTALQQHACGSRNVTTRPGNRTPTDHHWRIQYYAGQSLALEVIPTHKLRDERDWYYATQYTVTAP